MAVERFKHDGKWKIIGSSSGKVQVSDDKLDSESINSVQNKVITEALENKADIVDKLVNAYGIRSEGNVGYYMPNIDVGDSTHTLATKADIISNEALESKATMYNLYAMNDLTAEQLEANVKALESVQNNEVAIYKVYTNDGTYAIADVKLVSGPYLEAYVYVNTPNTTDKQATVTKYTYTFTQAGEYTTSDRQEVIVPSLSKVEEMIEGLPSEGTGSEVKIYKVYQNPQNEDELAANKAAYDASAAGANAIYQMNYILGWITATYVVSLGDICALAFYLTGPDEDDTTVQGSGIRLIINSDGSIYDFAEITIDAPSTEKVEEMISEAKVEIIDNLESENTTAALSANQGRVLSKKIDSEKENIINDIVSNEEVIAATFNDIHTVIKDIKENISKNATKEELQYEIDDLKSKIISNEEVIANALSDLNTKFLDLESRLRDVENNTEQ